MSDIDADLVVLEDGTLALVEKWNKVCMKSVDFLIYVIMRLVCSDHGS